MQKEKREKLLAQVRAEYCQAIESCSAQGVIYQVLNDLELIQKTGVEGLEPVLGLLKGKINLVEHEQAIEKLEQPLDSVRKIVGKDNEAFRRWRLGQRYQESEPVRAKNLMLVYVDYLRKNKDPGLGPDLKSATEHVAYVQEMVPPDSKSAAKREAYLRKIGHPDPNAGAKSVARMKARDYLEHALTTLEGFQSPQVAQVRDLLDDFEAQEGK